MGSLVSASLRSAVETIATSIRKASAAPATVSDHRLMDTEARNQPPQPRVFPSENFFNDDAEGVIGGHTLYASCEPLSSCARFQTAVPVPTLLLSLVRFRDELRIFHAQDFFAPAHPVRDLTAAADVGRR
jgi:hypothetical protein